jgi:hypothetical protein
MAINHHGYSTSIEILQRNEGILTNTLLTGNGNNCQKINVDYENRIFYNDPVSPLHDDSAEEKRFQ